MLENNIQNIEGDNIIGIQDIINTPFQEPTSIKDISGFIEVLSSVPTFIPKTFYDSIKIYNGSIYVYNQNTESWITQGQTNYAVGSDSRAASTGNQSFTGLGFVPKLVIFKAWKGGASASYTDEDLASHSQGHAKSSSDNSCHTFFWRAGSILAWINSQSSNLIRLVGADGYDDVIANLVSMDSDGFTINWATANNTCYFMWEAFG
jgi:hypothetical protein